MASSPSTDHDITIVGAGLSGILSAHELLTSAPLGRSASLVLLEGRPHVGGTWAFWRYPGFRSDSPAPTFAFPWHAWPHDEGMAEGGRVKTYLEDAAVKGGVMEHVRLRHKVVRYEWVSAKQRWLLDVEVTEGGDGAKTTIKKFTSRWLVLCSGYYDYDTPLQADIPGLDAYGGRVVHPQFWPALAGDDASNRSNSAEGATTITTTTTTTTLDSSISSSAPLDLAGKRVAIVGSGATTVTLLPALASLPSPPSRITMVQRSPSYIFSLARRSAVDAWVRRWVRPKGLASWLVYWRNMLQELAFAKFLLNFPTQGRNFLMNEMRKQLPERIRVEEHFNPAYEPLRQRLCMCPDGDFFAALRGDGGFEGKGCRCDVVTGEIENVTQNAIIVRVKPREAIPGGESGEHLSGGADRGVATNVAGQAPGGEALAAPASSTVTVPVDVIITATGLRISLFGGAATPDPATSNTSPATTPPRPLLMVDGVCPDISTRFAWRGCMLEGVPNLGAVAGYTMMTWTPGAELGSKFIAKVMRRAADKGASSVVPEVEGGLEGEKRKEMKRLPLIDLPSTYFVNARERMPLVSEAPWCARIDWASDTWALWWANVDEGLKYTMSVGT